MKTLFTLTMIILIVITSLVSFTLFEHAMYNFSALLILTSYISAALWIYILTSKKVVIS